MERGVGDAAVGGGQGEEAAVSAELAFQRRNDLEEHAEVDPLDGRAGQLVGAGCLTLVEGAEVLVLVDADAEHAVGRGGRHAAGAGLAAGAEDHVGPVADELLGVRGALVGRSEGLVVDLQHLDLGVDGLGAGFVAVHQLHDRRHVLAPPDDADDAALTQRRGQDAGEVPALVLVEVHAHVVGGVLGLELVDADEVGLGVRLGGCQRRVSEEEADGDDDVGLALQGGADVLLVVGLRDRLDEAGLEVEALLGGDHAVVGVLVEGAIVDLADVGDEADGEVLGNLEAGILGLLAEVVEGDLGVGGTFAATAAGGRAGVVTGVGGGRRVVGARVVVVAARCSDETEGDEA